MLRFIGLDLSITGTGVALWDPENGYQTSTIKTKPIRGDHSIRGYLKRARYIGFEIIDRLQPQSGDNIMIEGLSFGSKSGDLDRIHALWWRVADLLVDEVGDTPISTVTPKQRAKFATGNGNSLKPEVVARVKEAYPTAEVRNDNEADAVVLLAMRALHEGVALQAVELSVEQLAAMDLAKWDV